MTPVYEVRTRHTKKVLEDFIGFTFKMRNPRMTAMIAVFGVCLYTLAYIARDKKGIWITCLILGTLIIIFAFTRKKIAVSKLAKNDPNYQNQTDIHFVFGEKEFTVEDAMTDGAEHLKYGEIAYIYADDQYYYISINNEVLHMIPKSDFQLGSAEAFYQFISNKTKKDIRPTSIPWKMRIRMMMEYRDARAEAVERQQQEKKNKKK